MKRDFVYGLRIDGVVVAYAFEEFQEAKHMKEEEQEMGCTDVQVVKLVDKKENIPVSELKKAIERLERMEEPDVLGGQEWVVSVKDLKKIFSLSSKQEEKQKAARE